MAFSDFRILRLSQCPGMQERMERWFHEKWGIPQEAYHESMTECVQKKAPVPEWYVAMDGDTIIGGMGVIENDFHDRKDLAPNICAVYTEEAYRCRGVAGALLERVCADMAAEGIPTMYLLTDHDSFYERYGWEYFCEAQGEGEETTSHIYIHKQG